MSFQVHTLISNLAPKKEIQIKKMYTYYVGRCDFVINLSFDPGELPTSLGLAIFFSLNPSSISINKIC